MFFVLLCVVAAMIVAFLSLDRERRLLLQARLPALELPAPTTLLGHRVTEEEIPCGTITIGSGDFAREVQVFKYRRIVHGILPEWVSFGWWPEPSSVERFDRNALWVELLFNEASLSEVPNDGAIHSNAGDLVFESGIRQKTPPDPTVLDLGTVFLAKQLDVRAALERAALELEPRKRAVALRVLLRCFPDGEATARALTAAAGSGNLELAAISAELRGDLPLLRSIASNSDRAHAIMLGREEAVAALLRLGDAEGLASIELHPIPASQIPDYLESLRKNPDPRRERIALRYLESEGRSAAIDVLAAFGTRESVAPLQALLAESPPEDQRVAIEIAIELIQDRIVGRDGAGRGAISVAEPRGGSGALSETESESGAVSVADGEA